MARLFTCADVLEQLEDSNGDVSSGAYEGEGIVGYLPKATSFMPDAVWDWGHAWHGPRR